VAKVKSKHRVNAFGNSQEVCRKLIEGIRSLPGMGSRWKFARRFTEGIRKLVGNAKGDRRKEDRRTYHKITGVCRRFDLHPKKIGTGCQCASRRRTRKWM
ncbi:hypothetical protein B296_00031729, partial [Ensete ventricosum]